MKAIKKAAIAAGVLTAAGISETAVFYNMAMKRDGIAPEKSAKMSGIDWGQYEDIMSKKGEYMLSQPNEKFSRYSDDGLKLVATYFPSAFENPNYTEEITEGNTENKKRLVIGFHGYTSNGIANHTAIFEYFYKRGYALLFPDARAHGKSEGKYIGFGCLDRKDALGWINWAINKFGEDVEIMLYGTSMGGATVLMTSGLKLPPQVKGITSDCGFTSPKEVFTFVLNKQYHLPAFPVIQLSDIINKKLAGYGMDECNGKREVKKAKVPIFFIHGSADTFVPCFMCHEMYDACLAPKKKLIVEGAGHAESYLKDTATYERELNKFMDAIFNK